MKNKLKYIVQKYNTLLAYRKQYKMDFNFTTLKDTMIVFFVMVFAFIISGYITKQLDNLHFIILSLQVVVISTVVIYHWILYTKINVLLTNQIPIYQNVFYDSSIFILPLLLSQTLYFYTFLQNYINGYLYIIEGVFVLFIWIGILMLRLTDRKLAKHSIIFSSVFVFLIYVFGAYLWNIYQLGWALIVNTMVISVLYLGKFIYSQKIMDYQIKNNKLNYIGKILVIISCLFIILFSISLPKTLSYDDLYNKQLVGTEPNIIETISLNPYFGIDLSINNQNTFRIDDQYYYLGKEEPFYHLRDEGLYDLNFNIISVFMNEEGRYSSFDDLFVANDVVYAVVVYNTSDPVIYAVLYKLGSDMEFHYMMDLGTDIYTKNSIYLIEMDGDVVYFNFKEDYYESIVTVDETYLTICNESECTVHEPSEYETNEIIYSDYEYAIYTKDGEFGLCASTNQAIWTTGITFLYLDGKAVALNQTQPIIEMYNLENYLYGGDPIFTYDFTNYERYQWRSLKSIRQIGNDYVIITGDENGDGGNSLILSENGDLLAAFADESTYPAYNAVESNTLYIDNQTAILSSYIYLESSYAYYVLDYNNLGDLTYEKNGDYRSQSVWIVILILLIFFVYNTDITERVGRVIKSDLKRKLFYDPRFDKKYDQTMK